MLVRCVGVWSVTALLSVPLCAQAGSIYVEQNAALASLVRVSALIGTPAVDLLATWPKTQRGTPLAPSLPLSGAISLQVETTERPPARVERVQRVRVVEEAADTAALAARAITTLQWMQQAIGSAPTRCLLPLGGPAALFAAQAPARVWPQGLHGHPTMVQWSVTRDVGLRIITTVGAIDLDATVACDVSLP
jgi:hypothetical protein